MGPDRSFSAQSWLIVGSLLGLLVGCTQNAPPSTGREEAQTPIQDPDGGTIPSGDAGIKLPGGPVSPGEPRDAQLIRRENARPGTRAWRITKGANQNEIEGYALESTVSPGQRVSIAVSVKDEPRKFSWEVYRLGYYGGLGGREVVRGGPVQAVPQKTCPPQQPTGLIACDWKPTLEIQTDTKWEIGRAHV